MKLLKGSIVDIMAAGVGDGHGCGCGFGYGYSYGDGSGICNGYYERNDKELVVMVIMKEMIKN